jgi:hypothetical protein
MRNYSLGNEGKIATVGLRYYVKNTGLNQHRKQNTISMRYQYRILTASLAYWLEYGSEFLPLSGTVCMVES